MALHHSPKQVSIQTLVFGDARMFSFDSWPALICLLDRRKMPLSAEQKIASMPLL